MLFWLKPIPTFLRILTFFFIQTFSFHAERDLRKFGLLYMHDMC